MGRGLTSANARHEAESGHSSHFASVGLQIVAPNCTHADRQSEPGVSDPRHLGARLRGRERLTSISASFQSPGLSFGTNSPATSHIRLVAAFFAGSAYTPSSLARTRFTFPSTWTFAQSRKNLNQPSPSSCRRGARSVQEYAPKEPARHTRWTRSHLPCRDRRPGCPSVARPGRREGCRRSRRQLSGPLGGDESLESSLTSRRRMKSAG